MLYVVPTPLGNLEDITQRALRVLREAKAVFCEDTRRTRILMSHFGIRTPLLRYKDYNPRDLERILERLKAGEELALVSDSGTPVISDPGWRLVSLARKEGVPVTCLPGPCAAAAAVAGSGLPGDSFVFLGFLPRSDSKRRRLLKSAAALGRTLVVYESPARVLDLLQIAQETLTPAPQVAVARELSKVYEEWMLGSPEEVRARLDAKGPPRGEFVVLIHPGKKTAHDG